MKGITNAYLDKGYVTARVYIPEQDIKKSRQLKFVIEEGILSDIYYNGQPVSPYNGVIMSAVPRIKGKTLNMRDVEQGLDQMNRLASNNAKSDILPGKNESDTILNITNQPNKRWQVNLSHDNLGQASTGYARYNANLTLDNMLGVNDLWNFGYQRTDKDYWNGNKLDGNSNSYSGSVSIPNGYWTFNVSGYYYEYKSIVPGNFGPIKTSGDSSELRGSISRLLHRDNKSLTILTGGLAYKETNNFLLGNKIEVGSREYTVANLDLSHSRQMLGGTWTFDVNYMQGLDWFGTIEKHAPGAGDAEPEFSKVTGTISIVTPFKIKEQNFLLSNLLVGQYSPDNLFGAEQMSLGGYSNIRGMRDSLLYGNNGFFTRNEFAWRTVPYGNNAAMVKALGEFRPYVALDYGQVFAQAKWGFEDDNMASWTIGSRFSGGIVNLDIGYSDVFSTTVKNPYDGMAFVSMSVTF
ncbi:Polypeptide-transport-associated [Bartonella apihabitans]